jgi:AAA+ ATPase superfamily predicted ATPase
MLSEMEFIATAFERNIKAGKDAKRDPYYYICDPYIRFYLKAVLPQKSNIKKGLGAPPKNLDSLLGLQFEHVVRQNMDIVLRALNVKTEDVIYCDRYMSSDYEIDLLVETRRSFFIIEMKYYSGEVPQNISKQMENKLDRFGTPQQKSVKSVVIHANGVSHGLQNSDYVDMTIDIFDALNLEPSASS